MIEVVALGDVNVDIVAHFDAFPVQGTDAFACSTEIHCGGSAANTAMALAWMGVKTSLIARVGADLWGTEVLKNLSEAGVLLGSLRRDSAAMTGVAYIIVTPDGERTILGHRGANVLTEPDQISEEQIGGARLFHLSGYALLAEPQRSAARLALSIAHREGLTLSLDPAACIAQTVVQEIRTWLPCVDVLLPNLAEAQQLTGQTGPEDCARALLGEGVGVVALKLGQDGCLLASGEGIFRVPGFAIPVRDSTGAGDSFAAALLAGFLGGLEWLSAAVLANAMGATAAASTGAGTTASQVRNALDVLKASHNAPAHRQVQYALERAIGFIEGL